MTGTYSITACHPAHVSNGCLGAGPSMPDAWQPGSLVSEREGRDICEGSLSLLPRFGDALT